MTGSDSPDPVEAVRSDIEATRADLHETVIELSDRLDPKKRVVGLTEDLVDGTKQVVEQTQDVAKAGVVRGRQLADSRQRQLVGAALAVGLFLAWRLWRRRR